MYRRIIYILLALLVMLGSAMSISAHHQVGPGYIRDMRIVGMSGAYTAVADDYNALLYNPAGLGSLRSRSIGTVLHYGDYLQDGNAYHEPRVKPQFYVASPGWGVSVASEYYLNKSEDYPDTFRVEKVNTVDLGFGLNLGMFSFGTAIHASKVEQRDNVNLSSPSEGDFLLDFFTQVFFETYDPTPDPAKGESVLLRAGLLFDSGIISIGVHHENIFDIMAWTNDGTLPTLEGLADDLHVGISLRNPRLNRYGSRNLLRFRGAMDVKHVGSNDLRELQLGVETGVHITDSDRFVLRAGYSQPLENLNDLIFGALEPSAAQVSFGVGLDMLFLSLQGAVTAPVDYFFGDGEILNYGVSAGISF